MLEKIFYSFPIQLLILNLKQNYLTITSWVLLFAFVTQIMGKGLGIPYLLLDPEYLHKVNFQSFFILGISLGWFTMSFNITCYLLDGYKFNFLGSISKPFSKFCLNNSIIPLAFLITLIINIVRFQLLNEFQTTFNIIVDILGLLCGFTLMLTLAFIYFRTTNKDINKIALDIDKRLKKIRFSRANVVQKMIIARKKMFRVDYFFEPPLRIKKVDTSSSYSKEALLHVIDQNYLNAFFVFFIVLIAIMALGFFKDYPGFQIPAGASLFLLFSIFVKLIGILFYWFRGWAIALFFFVLVIINFFFSAEIFKREFRAYGLNYDNGSVEYSLQTIDKFANEENYKKDVIATTKILENWKNKFIIREPGKMGSKNTMIESSLSTLPMSKETGQEKPKIIFICTSGGGLRSAAWTLNTLQVVDSILKGKLIKHTILITGASGGLIGASYFRELYLQKLSGSNIDIYNDKYFDNITKDLLNPVIFSYVVSDFFFRFQKFSDGKYSYYKDRGYAFQNQLSINIENVLDKKVSDYKEPEQKGIIPMVFMAPTIINDGRKLYISAQNISYMCRASTYNKRFLTKRIKGVEFLRFFEKQDSERLNYMSALRMNATFPYVTPNITLPSKPAIEIMDAGLIDNFGVTDAIRFLYVFKDWIAKNTSGVIIVSIRDSEKDIPIKNKIQLSVFQKLFNPIGSLYKNWFQIQDFRDENMIEYAQTWFKESIKFINFQYIPKPKYWTLLEEKNINIDKIEENEKENRASLSWHLTTIEKESIKRTINEANNRAALRDLKLLLE